MNRSKRGLSSSSKKKISKAIRETPTPPSLEAQQDMDAMTEKELKKKFTNRKERQDPKPPHPSKAISRKKVSKRTTPGTVSANSLPGDSAPAYPHREGVRWIKNLLKKTLCLKTILNRHNRKK